MMAISCCGVKFVLTGMRYVSQLDDYTILHRRVLEVCIITIRDKCGYLYEYKLSF